MAAVKPAYLLINIFKKLYKDKYGSTPPINTYKHQHGFAAMINDYGLEEAEKLVQYFIDMNRRTPRIDDLLYNYENIKQLRDEELLDIKKRKRLRADTKRMVEEWEIRHG